MSRSAVASSASIAASMSASRQAWTSRAASRASKSSPSDSIWPESVLYAVDSIRTRSSGAADALKEELAENWFDPVYALGSALLDRFPAKGRDFDSLDPVSQGGLVWALKARAAFQSADAAILALASSLGGEDRGHPSDWKGVMDDIEAWGRRFKSPELLRRVGLSPEELDALRQGESDG